jgi:hypothetical protein
MTRLSVTSRLSDLLYLPPRLALNLSYSRLSYAMSELEHGSVSVSVSISSYPGILPTPVQQGRTSYTGRSVISPPLLASEIYTALHDAAIPHVAGASTGMLVPSCSSPLDESVSPVLLGRFYRSFLSTAPTAEEKPAQAHIVSAPPPSLPVGPPEELDVTLVMDQTGCTRERALKALQDHQNDIVEAIIDLTVS